MTDLIGRTLGSYKIIDELGHGGMANVYRAMQPSIGREVAIKVLPTNFLQDRTFLDRFSREVQIIARLQHPHILPVYDFGEQDGLPYIVMAYIRGGTLTERIHGAGSAMPLDEVSRHISQIAEGLDFAHKKGIVHRDFKPSNVLLDEAGNCYLSDFGIAKVTEASAHLTGSGIIGTPTYMAPEMADQAGVSHLIDIYALGVTLYQMVTGQPPYCGDTPMGVLLAHATKPIPNALAARPDLPEAVQHVIERAMAKDPGRRYQTAGELAGALRAAISNIPYEQSTLKASEAQPVTLVEPTHIEPKPQVSTSTPDVAVDKLPGDSHRSIVSVAWFGGAVIGLGLLCGLLIALLWALNGGLSAIGLFPTNAPALTNTPALTHTPVPTELPTPPASVSHNSDWAPIIQKFDDVEMVLVPPGCFMMGSTDEQIDAATEQCNRDLDGGCDRNWFTKEGPQHQICFDQPFWLARTEVTIGYYYGSQEARPGADRPIDKISWLEATDFCESRGERLPTEAEWEYAARGPDSLIYPWGNEFVPENVSYYDNAKSTTQAVGNRPGGVSWVGALDLLGNVSEWTSTHYDFYPYDAKDGREQSGSFLVTRGGSWLDWSYDIRAASRADWSPDYKNTDLGFRCARDY